MSRAAAILAIVAAVVLLLLGGAFFTVNQTQQALVVQLGEPKRVITEPGLQVKIPLFQNVQYFDSRILDVSVVADEIIAGDQKRFVADSFARYRIVDPLKFYQTVRDEYGARSQLAAIITSRLRRVVGGQTFSRVLSEDRGAIMRQIRDEANAEASRFGIDIIDVRIRRADLPEQNAQAIYQRMQSEREREAREFRAQGAEAAQRIRARAERDRTVMIAEAERDAQKLRGEGDAEASRIYAQAFSRDPEFYAFSRSLDAYREALGSDTTILLSPDSPFLRYLQGVHPKQQQ